MSAVKLDSILDFLPVGAFTKMAVTKYMSDFVPYKAYCGFSVRKYLNRKVKRFIERSSVKFKLKGAVTIDAN